jgi:hypothetical protein
MCDESAVYTYTVYYRLLPDQLRPFTSVAFVFIHPLMGVEWIPSGDFDWLMTGVASAASHLRASINNNWPSPAPLGGLQWGMHF